MVIKATTFYDGFIPVKAKAIAAMTAAAKAAG